MAMFTATDTPTATVRVRLWDLPLRTFHWALLAAVGTAIVTGKLGGAWMVWHGRAGIAITALLAFRLVWGLVGSTTARFGHFVPGPRGLWAYLRGRWRGLGHNPLGALSVLALLVMLAVQAGTGLVSNDDIAFTGPLVSLVDDTWSLRSTGWHRQLANGLFVLLGLHLAAIAYHHTVKKDALVPPMITGWKQVPAGTAAPRAAHPLWLAVAIAVGVLAGLGASGRWLRQPDGATTATAAQNAANHASQPDAPARSVAPSW